MTSVNHFNTRAGAAPHRGLFSTVTIVPPNASLAYISTQWAASATTGELVEGTVGDAGKQSAVIWKNVVRILKELGAEMKDVVHKTVNYSEFNDSIGKAVVEAELSVLPDEWKKDAMKSSLTFNGVATFHRPGIVYSVDLIVAVPNK